MSLSELFDLKPIGDEWIFEQLVTYPPGTCGNYMLANSYNNTMLSFNEYIIDDVTDTFDDAYTEIVNFPLDPYLNFDFFLKDINTYVKKYKDKPKSYYARSHTLPVFSSILFNYKFNKTTIIKYLDIDDVWISRTLNLIKHWNNHNDKDWYTRNDNIIEQLNFPYITLGNDLANAFTSVYKSGDIDIEFAKFFKHISCYRDNVKLQKIFDWHESKVMTYARDEIYNRSNNVEVIYFKDIYTDSSSYSEENRKIIQNITKWIKLQNI